MRASLPENLGDVERLLSEHGYSFERQRGSHRLYRDAAGRTEMFTCTGGGHKIKREYVDNLSRRLRRAAQSATKTTETRLDQTMSGYGNGHIATAQQQLMSAGALRTRKCNKCGQERPIDQYTHNGSGGRIGTCKACMSKTLSEAAQRRWHPQAPLASEPTQEQPHQIETPAPAPQPQSQPTISRSDALDVTLAEYFDMGSPSVFRAERFTVYAAGAGLYLLFSEDSKGPGKAMEQWMLLWAVGLMFCDKPTEAKTILGRVHF